MKGSLPSTGVERSAATGMTTSEGRIIDAGLFLMMAEKYLVMGGEDEDESGVRARKCIFGVRLIMGHALALRPRT